MQTLVKVRFTETDTKKEQAGKQTDSEETRDADERMRETAETPIQIKQTEEEQTATRKPDETLAHQAAALPPPPPLYTPPNSVLD